MDKQNRLHVWPINDIKKHTEENCECNPEYIDNGGSIIVIHNSFDGREGLEQVEEILKRTRPFE